MALTKIREAEPFQAAPLEQSPQRVAANTHIMTGNLRLVVGGSQLWVLLSERIWAAVREPKASPPSWAIAVAVTVAVAIAYFLSARLSLALLEKPDGVAVFWPAAGVASGALIVAGSAARWPVILGVMAATILANLLGDRNVWSSVSSPSPMPVRPR